jgi:hypothetical protein
MVEVMDAANRRRWERALLVVAALFGVVAMHATIGPMQDHAAPAPVAHSIMAPLSDMGSDQGAAAASSGGSDHGPTSLPHALMHLCLAIVTAGIVLGLLYLALLLLLRYEAAGLSPRAPVATVWPLPPRRTATRLAQLCVLRN